MEFNLTQYHRRLELLEKSLRIWFKISCLDAVWGYHGIPQWYHEVMLSWYHGMLQLYSGIIESHSGMPHTSTTTLTLGDLQSGRLANCTQRMNLKLWHKRLWYLVYLLDVPSKFIWLTSFSLKKILVAISIRVIWAILEAGLFGDWQCYDAEWCHSHLPLCPLMATCRGSNLSETLRCPDIAHNCPNLRLPGNHCHNLQSLL